MVSVRGTTVDVPTPDGTADAYLTHPDGPGPYPAVLFFTDAFGVRPQSRNMADRIAASGCAVLVPNVLHRHGRAPVTELPDFIGPDERAGVFSRLMPLMTDLTPERVVSDADAYLRWLAESPLTTDGPVALTGYCMGAGLALRTATAFPGRVAAVAGFHGAQLATTEPDSPHLLVDRLRGVEVYFAHADQDQAMPLEQIERLEQALTEAGVRHRTEVYAGARHGFTQADTAAYDAGADARHWAALLGLVGRALGVDGRSSGG
ncbi:dienelactone hydrolase family protein [Streptomyces clavuligerus]|uniref:Hydrolase n=1 Tax=Streptomyces clavuligerus TaxID=1901 RepID=D5SK65_STRCL|nr:dienelactone hydrolase family protein [Streptomyces clavuligerus]ANW22241.1 dienelactone hydrolase [Streptomyces clavuligerus]AXU17137.1 dienelactone hydrolase family protein [Streptomyces clavuligerus]EFG04308.1 hydrolase [Streptomyces clavuligerus]MBY6307217.1 dienelactone hydrolase family protein [Streptomyces clavuligerus]QCS10205.1 dienelactone hydrolase family protein [Streptomyces clavuligerus]